MRIAYILSSTVSLGGASKAFKTLLKGLMTKGVEPYVVMPDKNELYEDILNMGIPVFAVTSRFNAYPNVRSTKDLFLFVPRLMARLIVNQIATWKTAKWLSTQNIELIHSNVGVIKIGYNASRILRIPHIYHIREYADKDFGIYYFPCKQAFYRQLKKKQSYSICITKDIQNYYEQDNNEHSVVIYDGICEKKEEMPQKAKKEFFLFAGRLEPVKGLDFLLDAYHEYMKQNENVIPLYVAGQAMVKEYVNLVKRKIKDYAMEEHVHFLGERSDVEKLMQKAYAIIIASSFEGFGLCMPEAMFNGCLTIGRNTSGTKEQLDNGRKITNGEIALRYNTKEELTAYLTNVTIQSPSVFMPYRERAFKTVNVLYTQEANTDKVYKLYQNIINEESNKNNI